MLVGEHEVNGAQDNPLIVAMIRCCYLGEAHDEIPWCSACVNFICKLHGLPRTRTLRARHWLKPLEGVGTIRLEDAEQGYDIVVLQRGNGKQPDASDTESEGHVGFFAGLDTEKVYILGGNQQDSINNTAFPREHVLGVRRLR